MVDLARWLGAQLDEDERIARRAGDSFRQIGETGVIVATEGDRAEECASANWAGVAEHVVAWDPARVLREIDAKRQLLRAHNRPHECIALTGSGERSVVDGQPWELWEPERTSDHGPCTTLRLLALPYAGRPGYREEWAP